MVLNDTGAIVLLYAIGGLIIGFIAGILAANCILIYQTVRKGKVICTPRSFTLISLVAGDIFLALFSLVVKAKSLFEWPDDNILCITYLFAFIYEHFVIHFLYATGLVVLGFELAHRYKIQTSAVNTKENILKVHAGYVLPWILPLAVVLPLILAGSDVGSTLCIDHLTIDRARAAYCVSVILPAFVSVIVSISIMSIRLLPAYYTSPSISYQVTEEVVSINTQIVRQQYESTNTMANGQYPMGSTAVVHQFTVDDTGPQQYPVVPNIITHDPNLAGQTFSAPYTQYPLQQYSVQQYPGQQPVPPQYPIHQYTPKHFSLHPYITQPNVGTTVSLYPVQTQINTGLIFSDLHRERKILLLVSVTHFLCVVPYAVYSLRSSIDGYNQTFTETVVMFGLSWASVFRSLITPCIFAALNI